MAKSLPGYLRCRRLRIEAGSPLDTSYRVGFVGRQRLTAFGHARGDDVYHPTGEARVRAFWPWRLQPWRSRVVLLDFVLFPPESSQAKARQRKAP